MSAKNGVGIVESLKEVPSFSLVAAATFWWAEHSGTKFDHFESLFALGVMLAFAYVASAPLDRIFDSLVRPPKKVPKSGEYDGGGWLLQRGFLSSLETSRKGVREALGLGRYADGIYAVSLNLAYGSREWKEKVEGLREHSRTFRSLTVLFTFAAGLWSVGLLPIPAEWPQLRKALLFWPIWIVVSTVAFSIFGTLRVAHMKRLYNYVGQAYVWGTIVSQVEFKSDDSATPPDYLPSLSRSRPKNLALMVVGPEVRSLDGSIEVATLEKIAEEGKAPQLARASGG